MLLLRISLPAQHLITTLISHLMYRASSCTQLTFGYCSGYDGFAIQLKAAAQLNLQSKTHFSSCSSKNTSPGEWMFNGKSLFLAEGYVWSKLLLSCWTCIEPPSEKLTHKWSTSWAIPQEKIKAKTIRCNTRKWKGYLVVWHTDLMMWTWCR